MKCGFVGCHNKPEFVSMETLATPVCKAHKELASRRWMGGRNEFYTVREWEKICPHDKEHPAHSGCWGYIDFKKKIACPFGLSVIRNPEEFDFNYVVIPTWIKSIKKLDQLPPCPKCGKNSVRDASNEPVNKYFGDSIGNPCGYFVCSCEWFTIVNPDWYVKMSGKKLKSKPPYDGKMMSLSGIPLDSPIGKQIC